MKSTVSGPFLLNAIEQGKACAAYSGELSASKFLEWIMLQATDDEYVGVAIDKNTGKKFARVPNNVQERIRKWIDNKFYIFDNSVCAERSETKAVLECFKACARRYNCKIFLVDNLMSCLRTSDDEENKAQARFTADLKAFAVKYKVAVILVAHPRKTKPGEVFTSDDISGSSAISNLADTVLNIEKTEIGTSIRVTKNRDFGTCGVIECTYNPINRRIYESIVGDRTIYGWDHNGISVPDYQAKRDDYFIKPATEFGQRMYPW